MGIDEAIEILQKILKDYKMSLSNKKYREEAIEALEIAIEWMRWDNNIQIPLEDQFDDMQGEA